MTLPRISQPLDDDAFVQDPYPFYDRARAMGHLVWWDEMEMAAAVSHQAVSLCLRDRRLGRVAPSPVPFPDHLSDFAAVEVHSLLELEPPRHTALRSLVLHAFTSRQITKLSPDIAHLANSLIDRFPMGPHDLLKTYAQPLPVTIIARLLGVPEDTAPDLLRWSWAMVRLYTKSPSRDEQHAANAAARDFATFLRDHIAHRRAHPGDDLISELIAARDGADRLSEDEMISTAILLLNAGHEATVHMIGNSVKALIGARPDTLSDNTVEELMRLDPPLHLFTRWAYEDISIFGQTLPKKKGAQVACLLGAANRDPNIFDAPATFNPNRDTRKQLAFGAGLHFCVGAPLARLELKIALDRLHTRLPHLHLAEPPRYGNTYHFHGLERLMVRTS